MPARLYFSYVSINQFSFTFIFGVLFSILLHHLDNSQPARLLVFQRNFKSARLFEAACLFETQEYMVYLLTHPAAPIKHYVSLLKC